MWGERDGGGENVKKRERWRWVGGRVGRAICKGDVWFGDFLLWREVPSTHHLHLSVEEDI